MLLVGSYSELLPTLIPIPQPQPQPQPQPRLSLILTTDTSPYTRYEIWTFFYRMVLTGAVVLFEAGSALQFTVGIFMSVIILDVQLRYVLLARP